MLPLVKTNNDACYIFYVGGNQRELARAKNMKKQQAQGKGKSKESGSSLTQRKER